MMRITTILTGSAGNVIESEADLRFRLRPRHLAAVLWFDDSRNPNADGSLLKQLPTKVAEALESTAPPLVAARDDTTLWAWFRVNDEDHSDVLCAQVRAACRRFVGLKVALGLPANGIDGFISSHRQALTAYAIGSLGGSTHAVFPFSEVSCLSFLVADVARSRAWVADVLGPLSVGGAREAELRETLYSYISSGCSITATSRVLNYHKNTVAYRLRSAETLLGRSLDSPEIGLGLALHATHWLSDLVLRSEPVT